MKPAAFERVRAALSALKPEVKKPWVILDRLPYIHATDDPNAKPYSTPVVGRFDYMESADYILACNPAAISDILAYVDALKAERDAAMKDAERYRWLRNHGDSGCTGKDGYGGQESLIDERLDAAIDASIAKAEGGAA